MSSVTCGCIYFLPILKLSLAHSTRTPRRMAECHRVARGDILMLWVRVPPTPVPNTRYGKVGTASCVSQTAVFGAGQRGVIIFEPLLGLLVRNYIFAKGDHCLLATLAVEHRTHDSWQREISSHYGNQSAPLRASSRTLCQGISHRVDGSATLVADRGSPPNLSRGADTLLSIHVR